MSASRKTVTAGASAAFLDACTAHTYATPSSVPSRANERTGVNTRRGRDAVTVRRKSQADNLKNTRDTDFVGRKKCISETF